MSHFPISFRPSRIEIFHATSILTLGETKKLARAKIRSKILSPAIPCFRDPSSYIHLDRPDLLPVYLEYAETGKSEYGRAISALAFVRMTEDQSGPRALLDLLSHDVPTIRSAAQTYIKGLLHNKREGFVATFERFNHWRFRAPPRSIMMQKNALETEMTDTDHIVLTLGGQY
jgi:hypothetical protein